MAQNSEIHEVDKNEHLDFKTVKSKSYKVLTGCGNIYITCDFNGGNTLHKIRMQRTSKLHCPYTVLSKLYRSATFQGRRDIKQAIKDHKESEEDACVKFNIQVKSAMKKGELAAYSCSDAIAKVLEREFEICK